MISTFLLIFQLQTINVTTVNAQAMLYTGPVPFHQMVTNDGIHLVTNHNFFLRIN